MLKPINQKAGVELTLLDTCSSMIFPKAGLAVLISLTHSQKSVRLSGLRRAASMTVATCVMKVLASIWLVPRLPNHSTLECISSWDLYSCCVKYIESNFITFVFWYNNHMNMWWIASYLNNLTCIVFYLCIITLLWTVVCCWCICKR